ncbi:MAG TPA: VanW family protein [Gaiellaceae bacterium]|nr:VanW family protein [Gaiellaceae bacterium]
MLLVLLAMGFAFAGSPSRIPAGVAVAGVELGGLTASEAREKLAALAHRYDGVPVVFIAAGERWSLRPDELEVRVDWRAAVAEALAEGDGPLPLRGLERLRLRLFGAELEPHAEVYEPRLRFEIERMANAIDAPAREAAIELRALRPVVVPAERGRRLDRSAAEAAVPAALAGFERDPVPLPVELDLPEVTAADLAPAAADVRRVLSAPVRLTHRGIRWSVSPAELAPLLVLPADGSRELRIGGRAARRYFANLARGVRSAAVSADFAVAADGSVEIVPARPGRELDAAATGEGLLAAALRGGKRSAPLVIATEPPPLTTAEARKLGIERQLSSYTTLYSGTADRIQNLQRATALLDGARIAPGATFSFNERVGPRTEERGFRPAPVIMNGEYEEGIGGGVSQVATTVFNAAWEAGVKITARTAHALYIDRYPLGRDATVNYPDIDLRFLNDTGRWLVLAADYDESGIVVRLLGSGPERRVVSEAGELETVARPRVERTPDPTMYVGERVVEDFGEPARAVRVVRTVYERGEVLYRETWQTTYRSEPRLVRVGTKPVPAPEPPPSAPEEKKKKTEEEPAPAPAPDDPETGG